MFKIPATFYKVARQSGIQKQQGTAKGFRSKIKQRRCKIGFKYSALKLWSDAPIAIKDTLTLGCFKQTESILRADQSSHSLIRTQ